MIGIITSKAVTWHHSIIEALLGVPPGSQQPRRGALLSEQQALHAGSSKGGCSCELSGLVGGHTGGFRYGSLWASLFSLPCSTFKLLVPVGLRVPSFSVHIS